jgi:hypothetical protein
MRQSSPVRPAGQGAQYSRQQCDPPGTQKEDQPETAVLVVGPHRECDRQDNCQPGPEPRQGDESPLSRRQRLASRCRRRGGLLRDGSVHIGELFIPVSWLIGRADSRVRP